MTRIQRCGPLCLALILGGLLADATAAREALVTLSDGRTLKGELVSQSPSEIVLEIAGIRTTIDRQRVESIEVLKSVEQEYQERRAELDDGDLAGRFELAQMLYERGALGLAQSELNSLSRRFPDNPEVSRLSAIVRERIRLERESDRSREQASRESPSPREPRRRDATGSDLPYLTEEQMNLLKLWELPSDLEEAQPAVIIRPETIEKIFRDYADDERVPKGRAEQRQFRGAPGWEKLSLMFQLQARDLYPEVIVSTEPEALVQFRRLINPAYVVRYFATHFSGPDRPGPTLRLDQPTAPRSAYTNFYILTTASHEGKAFIDRSEPEQSLLFQWGLPRAAASSPAPEVPEWRPYFRGTDDPNFQQYVQWVRTLYTPTPDYGIQFPPPQPDADESSEADDNP